MDSNDNFAIKDMISIASPLIKALVDTFITPKLVTFKESLTASKQKLNIPTDIQFNEYYHRTYKKLAVVNTLVFNNSQRLLKDIYLPLTISSTNKKGKHKIKGFPKTISDKYGNILITDTAGMGKSTLMKKIFIDIVDENIGIPIMVELRRLSRDKTLIREIQEQLNSNEKSFNPTLLLDLLSEGGFIIILDGYDEISLSDRDFVTADLQDFIARSPNNRFFMTSRPEKALSSFGNFQEYQIEPLKKKEAFELLRKYDNQGQISALLIKKLEEQEMSNIEEFMTNPLLVSLLFTAFEHKQAIPFKKYLFYRQVFDANFESHDLTKGDSYTHDKYSHLEIDDFHRVLRHLGFSCLKLQKIEFIKDELLKLIVESREFCAGLKFNESDFLHDIVRTVPIFAQDGNYYRWAHKSLQEYFAAQFIYLDSKDKQNTILKKLYHSSNLENFINVLDLYYDMDYKTFRNVIEFELLSEFVKYDNNSYQSKFLGVKAEDIIIRKELQFMMQLGFFTNTIDSEEKNSKLGDGFTQMMKGIKHNDERPMQFQGIIIRADRDLPVLGLHFKDVKVSLLTLLYNKKNPIVKKLGHRSPLNVRPGFLQFIVNDYTYHEVTDSLESIFNSEESFKETNELVIYTKFFRAVIDHKEALLAFANINTSINAEQNENYLLDGI
jgi:hypothetical protein